jgi:hypothetical protein
MRKRIIRIDEFAMNALTHVNSRVADYVPRLNLYKIKKYRDVKVKSSRRIGFEKINARANSVAKVDPPQ